MERLAEGVVNVAKNRINYRENVELLEGDLQILTSRANDIEQKLKNEESSVKKRKQEVENWLKDVKKLKNDFDGLQNRVNEEGFWKHPLSGEHVVKLQKHVTALNVQSQTQQFNELVLDAHENRGHPRLTSRLSGKMFKDNLEKIKQCLLPESNIKSIGIYGMGGVGKTTLAKHINNHLLQNSDFHVCWLTVSQELSIKKLQDHIARAINLRTLSDNDEEEQRAAMLSRKLKEMKNFVLILDDVWEGFCLEKLGISLNEEYRLILTTRFLDVCRKMLCQKTFPVKTLCVDEAWDLFKDTLVYQTTLQADVEEVAREIAKECDGLPLGIITMAASMRGVEDLYEWRNALNQLKASSLGPEEMQKDVFPVLQWSFNRLDEFHQRCLLCCSLYPEDYGIDREEIIRRFISIDLMERRQRRTRKEEYYQGHAILNKLINSCLLEKAMRTSNGRPGVKMHDLIRDMALRITSGNSIYKDMGMPRYMVHSGVGLEAVPSDQKDWEEDLDIVSFMSNKISKLSDDTFPRCHNLSVLILRDNPLEFVADSFFDQFKTQLKVLDLSWTSIKKLPNCVSNLMNLTTLTLEHCRGLKHLPPLGKLKNLRELNLCWTHMGNIPQGLEELVNLKYLNMMLTRMHGKGIPEGTFSRLHNLQELRLTCAIEIKEFEGLKQLEIFRGHVFTVDSCYNKFFAFFHLFDWYHIRASDTRSELQADVLGFQVKHMVFEEFNFENKRREGGNMVLLPEDIAKLEVSNCSGTGTCLTNIIELKILNTIRRLYLKSLPEVERLPRGTFSCLESINIQNCHRIKKLFSVQLLQNLKNLRTIAVWECSKLEEIIAGDDHDTDTERPDSTSSSGTIFFTLPKLGVLALHDLPQLRSICNGTLRCASIDEIRIFECPNVRRLPLFLATTEN